MHIWHTEFDYFTAKNLPAADFFVSS